MNFIKINYNLSEKHQTQIIFIQNIKTNKICTAFQFQIDAFLRIPQCLIILLIHVLKMLSKTTLSLKKINKFQIFNL